MEHFICKYCEKECKNANSLAQHQLRCKQNPNRIKSGFELYNDKGHKGYNQYTKAKELGLEKPVMTEESRNKISNFHKGKHLTEEVKHKISESQKKYYLEHPDKIPYKLWHSSEISYPEQYFKKVFENENIDLKYHLQVGLYELDFYNENNKKYVEIDGATHYKKNVQDIDKRKDNYLNSLGWECFRIKWDEYQKLSYEQKHKIIETVKTFVAN